MQAASGWHLFYSFIPNNLTAIVSGLSNYVYENNIYPQLSHFMGYVFEKICMQYMIRQNTMMKLPFIFNHIGRWWGNNPVHKRQEEIDLIAFKENKVIFCECRWNNEPVGEDVIDSLIKKSNIFTYMEKYYYIFSKSGFKNSAINRKNPYISLIAFEDMVR